MSEMFPGSQKDGSKEAIAYWDDRASKAITDCERVEWSKRTQLIRFEAFLRQNDITGKTLLDVGCGVGDLWQHLQRRNIICDYEGFDISPVMINRCRERFPNVVFGSGDFVAWGQGKSFDYSIAVGIHNIKLTCGWDIFVETTRKQFELSRIAAHVSILTDRYSGFASHIQAWSAEKVLAMALEITPYVSLRHDYLPNDFSITLYRHPLIDTIDLDLDSFQ